MEQPYYHFQWQSPSGWLIVIWIRVHNLVLTKKKHWNDGDWGTTKSNKSQKKVSKHHNWWVVSNIFIFPSYMGCHHGMSSFPLTNSIIFQDGYCTTNQISKQVSQQPRKPKNQRWWKKPYTRRKPRCIVPDRLSKREVWPRSESKIGSYIFSRNQSI